MKIIAVIPARFGSTRFPGKPLMDICGKSMIQRVYEQVIKTPELHDVIVATDDKRIFDTVKKFSDQVIMTRDDHPNLFHRIHEVSETIEADLYVCVNGDEPMIEPNNISTVIQNTKVNHEVCLYMAITPFTNPAAAVDTSNIKCAVTSDNRCVYMSRSVVPFPHSELSIIQKYIGIYCLNKMTFDFYINAPIGQIEVAEGIDQLRFIENSKPIYTIPLENSQSLSVDTPKDLEYVRRILREKE